METFSTYLALCAENPSVTSGFPSQMDCIAKFWFFCLLLTWTICWTIILPSASTKLKGGYTGITSSVCPSVHLSVYGQNRVRSVSPRILIGSISYVHILSSNFRRWVSCNVRFKIQQFEILANFLNLELWLCRLLTWDPIWLNGMGNHEAAGGYPQNACVLVVLVITASGLTMA